MEFFKKIVLFILSVQEKMLTKNLNKTLGIKNLSKSKKCYQSGCLLSFDAIADGEREQMEKELLLILKTCNYDINELIKYIQNHNTEVYYLKTKKFLEAIQEEAGFIYPQTGLKAFCISLVTKNKVRFKTSEMFLFVEKDINKYEFLYSFYNWYTYKHGIEGVDRESQALLKKFLYNDSEEDFSKLQLSEIYRLKDAIKQDKASLDFVINLCKHYDGAKNALNKIQDDGANL